MFLFHDAVPTLVFLTFVRYWHTTLTLDVILRSPYRYQQSPLYHVRNEYSFVYFDSAAFLMTFNEDVLKACMYRFMYVLLETAISSNNSNMKSYADAAATYLECIMLVQYSLRIIIKIACFFIYGLL